MADLFTVKLLMSEFVTHDVKRFIVSRPDNFEFEPGQGVELAINKSGWKEKGRPFTPTGLAGDDVLQFIIKRYPSHKGVTEELHGLDAGTELLMSDPFGTIRYQGPGVFVAGGAGVTPFIAILRERMRQGDIDRNTLLYSSKTAADIICEKELRHYLGRRCILTCTAGNDSSYENRRIDKDFLAEKIQDFNQPFYVCGPPGFRESVSEALQALGADSQGLVFEQ